MTFRTLSERSFLVRALIVVASVALLADCRSEPKIEEDFFEVAILTASPRLDTLDRSAVVGLHRIERELQAVARRGHDAEPGQRRELIRDHGEGDADLVFCIGAGFEPVLFSEAASYPGTDFVLVPGDAQGPNVASIAFHVGGAGYIAGVVAAEMAEDNLVGVIQGAGPEWFDDLEDGFVAGFTSIRRNAEVVRGEGPIAAEELAAAGVRVALYSAEVADPAVLEGAKKAGLLLVAADPKALRQEKETVFSAVAVDLPEAMVRVAQEARDGLFEGRVYLFDYGSGVVQLRMSELFDRLASDQAKDAYLTALSEVTAGIVEVESLGM